MRISLFIPCFVNHYYPEVGVSMVKILRHLGHDVDYPDKQTCCGQPSFNTGYWDEARETAKFMLGVFERCDCIVTPSGSCGAMLKVFYPELFKDSALLTRAQELAGHLWEFSDFLVNKLHVTDLGASFPHTVTFHDGCHGLRELGIKSQPRILLQHIRDLKLIEMQEAETCCGFGGTFSVKFPEISTAMAEVKCESALAAQAEYIVSNDSSCLMHIQGYASKSRLPIKSLHLSQILAAHL